MKALLFFIWAAVRREKGWQSNRFEAPITGIKFALESSAQMKKATALTVQV